MGQTINKIKFVYMLQNIKVRLKRIQTSGSFKAEWVMFQHFFNTNRCQMLTETWTAGCRSRAVCLGIAKSYLFIFKVQYEYPVSNLI